MNHQTEYLSTILVVDDDITIRKVLEQRLSSQGFRVLLAKNGMEALDVMHSQQIDLIVLDVIMPGMDGFQVCREIRKTSEIPIIIVSVLSDVGDRLQGLELGADDYMIKPFSPKELTSRIYAILRRFKTKSQVFSAHTGVLHFGFLSIDKNKRKVFMRGQHVRLTEIEFCLLEMMVNNPGVTVTREQFLQKIWGYIPEQSHERRVIDVHMSRLRESLHNNIDQEQYIFTVRGKGYRFLDNH